MQNKSTYILKTGHFGNINSAEKLKNFRFCPILLTLLMMTAESMLSKCPVSTIKVVFLFSPLALFIPYLTVFRNYRSYTIVKLF